LFENLFHKINFQINPGGFEGRKSLNSWHITISIHTSNLEKEAHMRSKSLVVFLFFLVMLVIFSCDKSPVSPSSEDERIFSGDPLIVEVEKEPVDGKVGISFYLTSESFDSVNTKTELVGFDDGRLQGSYISKDNRLFFWVEVSPGIYVFSFNGDKDDPKESIISSDSFWVPEIGKFAIKVTKDYKVVKASLSEVLHLGKDTEVADSVDSVIVVKENSDGKVIIKIVKENDTIFDTVTVSKSKGTIVLLGDSVIYKKPSNPSSLGYDTIRLLPPQSIVDYNNVVRSVSFEAVTVNGEKKFKEKVTIDSVLVRKIKDKVFKPFAIGLPNWKAWSNLGVIDSSTGRYPFTTEPMSPGLITFCVGGNYQDNWADSSKLKKSAWGFKTKDGWIMAGWLFPDGRFVAWSLVDTTTATVKDSVKIDTVVIHDTIVDYDTTVVRDTIVKQGKIIILRDSVIIIRTRVDTLLKVDTLHDVDTITVNDTTVIKDTIIIRDTVVVRDTIVKQGDTIIFRDSVIIIRTRVDTLLNVDTLHNRDTMFVYDLGVEDVDTAFIVISTFKVAAVGEIVVKDSFYIKWNFHNFLNVVNKDSSYLRDTISIFRDTTEIDRDTNDLVLVFKSATAVGDSFDVKFKVVSIVVPDDRSFISAMGFKGTGVIQSDTINSTSKSDGYFNFSVRIKKGTKYRINFRSGTAWAEQVVLRQSKFVFVEGTSVDLAVSLNNDATGFDYASPAAQ
jgi:hypothetical protein